MSKETRIENLSIAGGAAILALLLFLRWFGLV